MNIPGTLQLLLRKANETRSYNEERRKRHWLHNAYTKHMPV